MRKGWSFSCTVTGTHRYSVQGGLEIPCILVFETGDETLLEKVEKLLQICEKNSTSSSKPPPEKKMKLEHNVAVSEMEVSTSTESKCGKMSVPDCKSECDKVSVPDCEVEESECGKMNEPDCENEYDKINVSDGEPEATLKRQRSSRQFPTLAIVQATMGDSNLVGTFTGVSTLYIVTPGTENRAERRASMIGYFIVAVESNCHLMISQ